MNTQFNSNVIWLQSEYKVSTLIGSLKKFAHIAYLIVMVLTKVDILYSNCSHITFELNWVPYFLI